MQKTPTTDQIERQVVLANQAATNAAETRARERGHRRPMRTMNLEAELEACANAAKPLRRWIGMVFAHDIDVDLEVAMKRAVKALDVERRKLRKLL